MNVARRHSDAERHTEFSRDLNWDPYPPSVSSLRWSLQESVNDIRRGMLRRRDRNCSMSPIARSEHRNRPTDDPASLRYVCFWHKADTQVALTNLPFRG